MENATSPKVLGICGFGNMGGAIARGVRADASLHSRFPLLVHERHAAGAQAAQKAGLELAKDAIEFAQKADIILMAVKPDQMATALTEFAPALTQDKILISIAAGVNLQRLTQLIDHRCPVVRVMPNTPAVVGKGIFGLCLTPEVSETNQQRIRDLFKALGTVIEIPEYKMNAFTALSGSGPGYVFHFMESLAEAGVSAGLDRASSTAIALGLVEGCAAMAKESGLHPAVLREQVSSPAGTTIAGTNHLDRTGTRGHLVDAVLAATARGKALEEESSS